MGARLAPPILLAGDAVAFWVLVHHGLERLALGLIGAVSLRHAAAPALASLTFAAIPIAALLTARITDSPIPRALPWRGAAVVGVLVALAWLVFHGDAPRRLGLEALPWFWRELPRDLEVGVRLSAEAVKATLMVLGVGAWALASDRIGAKIVARALLGAWSVLAVCASFGSGSTLSGRIAVLANALLPLLALALFEAGHRHGAARMALASALTAFLGAHRAGMLPLGSVGADAASPLVELSPLTRSEGGGEIDWSISALALAPDGRSALVGLEDSDGLARIQLETGAVSPLGLGGAVTRIATAPPPADEAVAWAADRRELVALKSSPLAIRRWAPRGTVAARSVSALAVVGRNVLLASPDRAAIWEHDLENLVLESEHRLAFPEAAKDAVGIGRIEAGPGSIYASVLSLDSRDRAWVVRIDRSSWKITASAAVTGSDAMVVVPRRSGSPWVLVADRTRKTIEALDGETLSPLRTIKAPVDVRALVHEPRRDVVLALGVQSRELAVLDLRIGGPVKRSTLPRVPSALALDPAMDRVVVGDARGIHGLALSGWLYPPPPRSGPDT